MLCGAGAQEFPAQPTARGSVHVIQRGIEVTAPRTPAARRIPSALLKSDTMRYDSWQTDPQLASLLAARKYGKRAEGSFAFVG